LTSAPATTTTNNHHAHSLATTILPSTSSSMTILDANDQNEPKAKQYLNRHHHATMYICGDLDDNNKYIYHHPTSYQPLLVVVNGASIR
jgi:hypothetical protein